MPQKVRIALDAMGGDHGPSVVVPGAALALDRHPDSDVHPVRRPSQDRAAARQPPAARGRCRLVHTDVAVRMDDKPSQALRNGRWKSSMWLAIDAVKKGEADVAVSAGNTGALMAMAKFNLKMMPGIERPAIAALWPTIKGSSIVLDLGASIGADAGATGRNGGDGQRDGARAVRARPAEAWVCSTSAWRRSRASSRCARPAESCARKRLPHIDYIGFVEGDDIGKGKADVVVTEGFAGNIALKTAEGTARQFADYLRGAMIAFALVEDRLSVGAAGVPHVAREDGPAANPMAAFSSASMASSSRATAAPIRKASPPPSTWATTWCVTNCSPRSARCCTAMQQALPEQRPSAGRPRERAAFGRAGMRQLSARTGPHQPGTGQGGRHLRRMDRAAHRHP